MGLPNKSFNVKGLVGSIDDHREISKVTELPNRFCRSVKIR